MALHKKDERICRKLGDLARLPGFPRQPGPVSFRGRGDLDGAMALYKEQEEICRDTDDPAGRATSFGNQASPLEDRDSLGGAGTA